MPPSCSCATDYDALFDARTARRELAAYRRKGATGTTRRLIRALREAGTAGSSVLDIGAGVGVIGAELLRSGAASLTDVEASEPYLAAARSEVERRGFSDRATFRHGDFVAVASEIEPADVVTLDRVLCCYPDWRALVDSSAVRSRRLYGIVYPIDRWWMRASVAVVRLVTRLIGHQPPFHVHPDREVDARVREHGFRPILHERGLAWQTVLYARTPT